MSTLSSLWQHAAAFAAQMHAGQTRKDGRTPYIAHPFRVALVVRHLFACDDETALAAALLHDVLEDTTADYDDLLERFTPEVAAAVAALTKDSRLPYDEREAAYDRQLAAAAWQAKLVKLADVYDNVTDCLDAAARRRTLVNAERALALAADEPRCAMGVGLVRELVERCRMDA